MGDRHPDARVIRRMARQEERHREILDKLLAERGVRPTAMQPLWDVAGFALGAATALMGPRAAMACTAAVETEIERHYNEQLDAIGDPDPELTAHIRDFRDEEGEHARPAIAPRAEQAHRDPHPPPNLPL